MARSVPSSRSAPAEEAAAWTGAPAPAPPSCRSPGPGRSPLGTFASCPLCDGGLIPEHAHFRCPACGWRDSCCD